MRALRPGLSDEQVRTLRASPLSGDWRYIDGQLELVGALAVNLPGFLKAHAAELKAEISTLSQLEARSAEIAKQASRPVIAYCARGNRSRMAASALAKAGFAEIYHLSGGIDAWRAAGLPVEK